MRQNSPVISEIIEHVSEFGQSEHGGAFTTGCSWVGGLQSTCHFFIIGIAVPCGRLGWCKLRFGRRSLSSSSFLNKGWFSFAADSSMKSALETYDAHAADAHTDWFLLVDWVFLLFFILELVVVILAMSGSRSLVRRDFIYLFVDAVVVFVGVLEVVFTLCGITSSFLKNFRLLKLVRLGDLPHTLKNANFCGKLTRMISALTHSVENLFWGCCALC